jgi:hypothetical protein
MWYVYAGRREVYVCENIKGPCQSEYSIENPVFGQGRILI